MGQYLIDTNCISDYLSASLSQVGMQFMDEVINAVPNISIITQIELLCWETKDIYITNSIKQFLQDCNIFDITTEVVLQTVGIRKSKKVKTPDAIIAATAVVHGYALITNNVKDFENIAKLKLINVRAL